MSREGNDLFAIDSDGGLVAFGHHRDLVVLAFPFLNSVRLAPGHGYENPVAPYIPGNGKPAIGIDQEAVPGIIVPGPKYQAAAIGGVPGLNEGQGEINLRVIG